MQKISISIFSLYTLFMSFSVMGSELRESQTVLDLKNIANYYRADFNEDYENAEHQVEFITESLKNKLEHTFDKCVSDVLDSGLPLLKTAEVLEKMAKNAGYTLWWRYTNGIEGDIEKQKPKSFSRTLLAGFINDGVSHFRDGIFGFDTACAYVYWANTHYFENEFFKEHLAFVNDLESYIQNKNYKIKTDVLNEIKEFFENKIKDVGFKVDYSKLSLQEINSKIIQIITDIQYDPTYKRDSEENIIIDLYNRKTLLFAIDCRQIKEALSGSLLVLPLHISEEQKLLEDFNNRYVISLDQSVFGRGENFHPRLSSEQLKEFKHRFISVYFKGQLSDLDQLKKELSKQVG